MKKNTFVEGTVIASIAIIITKLLGALYVIPFYSVIGEQGGSLYSYAYNVYNLFLNISTAGIPIAMSKIISEYNTLEMYEAKERSYKIGRNTILIVSMLAFLILFVFAPEIAYLIIGDATGGNTITDIGFVIRSVSLCILIIPFLSVTKGYLQGHKYISPTSVSQVIEQIVRIIIVLLGSYLAIVVFKAKVSIGVAVALIGAFVGGLVAYLYLKYKISKNKKQFNYPKDNYKDNVSTKTIIKKIFSYAFPLIIISIAFDIYGITDLSLVIRGLRHIGYSTIESETISSIIATWGIKICMIINAVATGLSISLIPHMVSSFVKKEMDAVNRKFNQALSVIFVMALPLTIAISILSLPFYNVFYGVSEYGPVILKYLVFTAFIASIYIVISTALQSLSKYKIVYLSTITGLIVNAALDIPLILLFNKIGLPPFYGAITSTVIGYLVSFIISLTYLKKSLNFNYKLLLNTIKKLILPSVFLTFILLFFRRFINFESTSRLYYLSVILFNALIGGVVYLIATYKNGALFVAFGEEYVNKLINKINIFKKIFKSKK